MRRRGIFLSTPIAPAPNKARKKELDLERVWVVIADPMNPLDLTVKQLKRAAAIKDHIEKLNKELGSLLGPPAKKKRILSAAVRRKIAASQKARWTSLRRAKSGARSSTAATKQVSAATRAKLRAKLKAYWAAKKRKAN
jgi:hypothetical protein